MLPEIMSRMCFVSIVISRICLICLFVDCKGVIYCHQGICWHSLHQAELRWRVVTLKCVRLSDQTTTETEEIAMWPEIISEVTKNWQCNTIKVLITVTKEYTIDFQRRYFREGFKIKKIANFRTLAKLALTLPPPRPYETW